MIGTLLGTFLGTLSFLNPWALAALLGLPALYFLLRITPPAPKKVAFPAVRLLAYLQPKQNTPSHTPWWILLLRMIIAALLLVALAQPVLNPAQVSDDKGPLVLIIDNGFGAAQNWDDIRSAAENEIKQAGRRRESIYVLSTAPETGTQAFAEPLAMTQSTALSHVRGLKPQPWPSDLEALRRKLPHVEGYAVWLSDGFVKTGYKSFVKALKTYSTLSVYTPDKNALPLALKKPESFQAQPSILLQGAAGRTIPARVQLLDERGKILDEVLTEIDGASFPLKIDFDLPASVQNHAASFRVVGQKNAAARYFLDHTGGPKTVGIVAPEDPSQTEQFSKDSFYLSKALEPYASILQGALSEVIDGKPSVIILPDIGAMPPDTLNALSAWVSGGGLLLRFAGPNMAEGGAGGVLTPVRLRKEARSVEGSLSWDKPLKIKGIAPESPLYGLSIDEDTVISGQILPEAPDALEGRVWAQLEDGTPLITAAERDSGMIVMVHTSASPQWSNMALSGFYVQMLKRILKFSGQSGSIKTAQDGLLQPVRVLDGFGAMQSPQSHVSPVNAAEFEGMRASPSHPPGFYGRGGLQRAFNLGDEIEGVHAIEKVEGAGIQRYGQVFETDLFPALITAAFILFILDGVIMLILSGAALSLFKRGAVAAVVLSGFLMIPFSPALAQDAANDLYLAYVKTGSASIDATSQKGLEVLSAALNTRTSAEPKGVKGINLESDVLIFYPLLYWPISAEQKVPSSKALQNLQDYLDHGGTILVDTRDGRGDTPHLRRILEGLNIPPLTEFPEGHVLGKSFYLLKEFPGRYEGGALWIESTSAGGRDGVSSVILGSHDWAGAWAEMNVIQRGSRQYIQGASRRHEMSLRFGVNLVMYALTGNYKADQVHVPHILKRLGNDRGAR